MKKIVKNADVIVSCFLLVVITVLAFLQVLFRFVLNLPLSWTEELIRFAVISLIYISTIYSIRTRSVIRVEILDMAIKGKVKNVIDILINIFSAGIMGYMSYLSTSLVSNAVFVNQRSAAMNMPIAIMYGVECACFALMSLAFISLIIEDIKKLIGGNKE